MKKIYWNNMYPHKLSFQGGGGSECPLGPHPKMDLKIFVCNDNESNFLFSCLWLVLEHGTYSCDVYDVYVYLLQKKK